MTAEIHIFGPTCVIQGVFPLKEIREATCYPVQGAEFSPAFRKGIWDGNKHLFNKKDNSFPTGLLTTVKEKCEELGYEYSVTDHRDAPRSMNRNYDLIGVKMEGKYDYQLKAAKDMVEKKQGIVKVATNGGKCLGPEVPVRMFDGSVKLNKDIVVGDQLMGPDSLPRTVLSTTTGRGKMYKIILGRGASYTCNADHVLTLKLNKYRAPFKEDRPIMDIPLKKYLERNQRFRNDWRHFSVAVDYPEVPTSKDPYEFGRDIAAGKEKRIPNEYLINSYDVREKLLSGIDEDIVPNRRERFDVWTIRFYEQPELLKDIYHLVKSMGIDARPPKPRDHNFKYTNNRTDCYFKVEPIGIGDYCGFTLDGDGRFLLEDYVVTHNTEIACAVTQYIGQSTLFLVSTVELLYQARERFKARLGLTNKEVGVIGDSVWEPGSWITISMIPTLESRLDSKECLEFLSTIDVVFVDECHHSGSETWYSVLSKCPAYYRYGLSGTPLNRSDGADLRLIALTGDIIVNISNKFLVERGVSAKAEIIFDKITEPKLPRKMAYPKAYKEGVVDNEEFLEKIVEWTKAFHENGLSTLILVEEISHGKRVDDALWNATDGQFIPHQFISGQEDTKTRKEALDAFAKKELPVLIGSVILDEGVDVPTVDAMILAGSRKSTIRTLQRLGRGLRGQRLIAVEFANMTQKYLLEHSLTRLETYKEEECFPIHQFRDTQDKSKFIKELWSKPTVEWNP